MTDNKGDLISREALKKSFEDTVCIEPMPYAFVKQIINNAPTVTPDKIQAIMNDYLVYRCEPQRPQGKWIYDEKICNWKCSECGETPKTIGYVGNREFMTEHFKYCNHCGAQMEVNKNEID